MKVHLEGGLGGVDVLPSPSVGCIYLTGDEVTSQLSSSATRSRLTDLAKVGAGETHTNSSIVRCASTVGCGGCGVGGEWWSEG